MAKKYLLVIGACTFCVGVGAVAYHLHVAGEHFKATVGDVKTGGKIVAVYEAPEAGDGYAKVRYGFRTADGRGFLAEQVVTSAPGRRRKKGDDVRVCYMSKAPTNSYALLPGVTRRPPAYKLKYFGDWGNIGIAIALTGLLLAVGSRCIPKKLLPPNTNTKFSADPLAFVNQWRLEYVKAHHGQGIF